MQWREARADAGSAKWALSNISVAAMQIHAFLLSCVLSLVLAPVSLAEVGTTALDDYVSAPDPDYAFTHLDTRNGEGYTIYEIAMASQQWRSPAEVDRTLWQHQLLIAVPWSTLASAGHTALLVVNGGQNKKAGSPNDDLIGLLSVATGAVSAMINQVPNQPLIFSDEGSPRTEDALLAYGMDKYLATADAEWLVQLPMTKAVVRAMDTVQTFVAELDDWWVNPSPISDFIVAGGSKRGWATWLTAAVEARKGGASRVKAILPISIDLLNLGEQFRRHWEAYGFYTPAIHDYADFDLPCRAQTPAGRAMVNIIDPYAYRERLTMPKLVINSAGDQFFLPDSSQLYFADLPEPKLLRYTFNTDHTQGQDPADLVLSTLSWLEDRLKEEPSPAFDWILEPDGSIRLRTSTPPDRVRLWQATNAQARDFRLETLGPDAWQSTQLVDDGQGVYLGQVTPPPQGWTAFSLEVTYPGAVLGSGLLAADRVFTTDIQVLPPDLPFAGTGCSGIPASATLTVTRTGNGTVTSLPPGIDCGATCSADFDGGTQVALKAVPMPGSYFAGWSGACAGMDDCNLVMDQARAVGATFKLENEFADVPADSWAYGYIHAIRDAGITRGCGGYNFCPQGLVTREEMAAFLIRALEGEPQNDYCGGLGPFGDVDAAAWSCPYIKRLSERGITNGCGGNNYCPDAQVSREQVAALIVRAIDVEPEVDYCGGVAPFFDVSPSAWSCGYIQRLVELGVTQGCGNGYYCPKASVTREQMAAFLARAFIGMH